MGKEVSNEAYRCRQSPHLYKHWLGPTNRTVVVTGSYHILTCPKLTHIPSLVSWFLWNRSSSRALEASSEPQSLCLVPTTCCRKEPHLHLTYCSTFPRGCALPLWSCSI